MLESIMRYFLFVVLIFSELSLTAQSNTRQKVLTIEKQRFAAMITKDTLFLQQVLADNLIYSHSSGEVDTKESLIKAIVNGDLIYKKMDLQDIESRVYKNTVILNGRMYISLGNNRDDKVLELKIKYLDVYRKLGKAWKLVAWQSAKLN